MPMLGRLPGGGCGNTLHYSCLKNHHGQRSPASYSPWGCKELDMTEAIQHTQKNKTSLFFFFLYFYKSNIFVNSLAIAVFNSIIRSSIKPFSAQFLLISFEWTICFLFLLHFVFEDHWPFKLNNVLTLGFRFFLLPRAAIFCYCFLVYFHVLIMVGILYANCQPEYKLKVSVLF